MWCRRPSPGESASEDVSGVGGGWRLAASSGLVADVVLGFPCAGRAEVAGGESTLVGSVGFVGAVASTGAQKSATDCPAAAAAASRSVNAVPCGFGLPLRRWASHAVHRPFLAGPSSRGPVASVAAGVSGATAAVAPGLRRHRDRCGRDGDVHRGCRRGGRRCGRRRRVESRRPLVVGVRGWVGVALGGRWRSGWEGRDRCARWPGRSPIGRRRGARLLRQRNRSQRSARQRRWPCVPPIDESPNHADRCRPWGAAPRPSRRWWSPRPRARRRSQARPHGRAAQRLRRWAVGDQLTTAL